jgi:hypothetical protein
MVGLGIVLPLMELRIRGIHELGSPTNQAVFFQRKMMMNQQIGVFYVKINPGNTQFNIYNYIYI